jgi:hypothetical protein
MNVLLMSHRLINFHIINECISTYRVNNNGGLQTNISAAKYEKIRVAVSPFCESGLVEKIISLNYREWHSNIFLLRLNAKQNVKNIAHKHITLQQHMYCTFTLLYFHFM